jgi:hypothetical protein
MAVFEGLFPDQHNGIIMDLLFELATWHGFAKFRLHTESTLQGLDFSTTRLGSNLRRFQVVTCEAYITRELPSEEAARGRRKAAAAAKQSVAAEGGMEELMATTTKRKANHRKFNLATYKVHALGDYVKFIRMYGTTDNYSTQLVRNMCI